MKKVLKLDTNEIFNVPDDWFGWIVDPNDKIITEQHQPYWNQFFGENNYRVLPDVPEGMDFYEWDNTNDNWVEIPDPRGYEQQRTGSVDGYAIYREQFDMQYRAYKILVEQFQATQQVLATILENNPDIVINDELKQLSTVSNDGIKEHILHCEGVKTRYPIPESVASSDNPPDDTGANP